MPCPVFLWRPVVPCGHINVEINITQLVYALMSVLTFSFWTAFHLQFRVSYECSECLSNALYWERGKLSNMWYPKPTLTQFSFHSHVYMLVKIDFLMEICFFHFFLYRLSFPHRCCDHMWWIQQYLSLGSSEEFFGKICKWPWYRPQKDTGMDISNTYTNPQFSFIENIVRLMVFLFISQMFILSDF